MQDAIWAAFISLFRLRLVPIFFIRWSWWTLPALAPFGLWRHLVFIARVFQFIVCVRLTWAFVFVGPFVLICPSGRTSKALAVWTILPFWSITLFVFAFFIWPIFKPFAFAVFVSIVSTSTIATYAWLGLQIPLDRVIFGGFKVSRHLFFFFTIIRAAFRIFYF